MLLAELGRLEGSDEGVVDVEKSHVIALLDGEEQFGFVRRLLFAGGNDEDILNLISTSEEGCLWAVIGPKISVAGWLIWMSYVFDHSAQV